MNGLYWCISRDGITELIEKSVRIGCKYFLETHDMANVAIYDPKKTQCIAYMDEQRAHLNFEEADQHRDKLIEEIVNDVQNTETDNWIL